MTLILSQAPLAEPVTLSDVKMHLRLDHDDEDNLLNDLIKTATEYLEQRTGLALITQTWRLCRDEWPKSQIIQLHKTPVQDISSVEVYEANGLPEMLDVNDMTLDAKSRPARLYVGQMQMPGQVINGIEVEFTAGFGNAVDVPDSLKRAIILHVAHMYEFRGVVEPSMQPASTPVGYESLIAPWNRKAI